MNMTLKRVREVIPSVKDPRKFSRDQYITFVSYLVEKYDNTDYRRQQLSALNQFLARHENYVYTSVHFKWAPHIPKNVFWLSNIEMGRVWDTSMDPIERMMIWMESRIGARRIEVLRCKTNDINFNQGKFYLRGKGGSGTKGRRLRIPPSGYQEIPRFEEFRNKAIERKLQQDPKAEIPPNWMIYWSRERCPKLRTLKETTADNLLFRVCDRCGIYFTHHTLRRTYGRKLYDMDVKLEKISKVLGHSSTKHTERYLGLSDDDVAEAMFQGERDIMNKYIQNIEVQKNVEN